jgi:hypothetical protein
MFPQARQHALTVRELADETLVYDQERHKAHCLNATAALVWRHCDGRTSPADLARIVAAELAIPSGEEVVALALEHLARRHLLEQPPEHPGESRISRRETLKKLAIAAASLPIILTITTKAAAQSLSGGSSSDDSSSSSTPKAAVNVNVTVPVTIGGSSHSAPAPPPCRTRGQSCVAASSGQQGTCCAGLVCGGVFQGAGVCG